MTRKDFELIASALVAARVGAGNSDWYEGAEAQYLVICQGIASRLASTNPGFDRARFLAACGLDD